LPVRDSNKNNHSKHNETKCNGIKSAVFNTNNLRNWALKNTSKVFNTKYSIQITYVTGLSKITSKVGILGEFYPMELEQGERRGGYS